MTATATAPFRERVEQAFAELQRQEEEEATQEALQKLERTRSEATKLISSVFGPETHPDFGFAIDTSQWPSARFTIDGIPFQVRYHESEFSSGWELCVESRCTRAGCTKQDLPALTEVFDITGVGRVLHSDEAKHGYHLHCADGSGGSSAGDDALGAHQISTERYAAAVRLRRELEFRRPIEKGAAIKRIMDAGQATSATAAEKLVESEPEYAKFCHSLTDAVIDEIVARETLSVARLRAGIPALVEHDR